MRAVAGHLTIRWMIDGFQTFNQDPKRQFATIRRRLETEPMTDYILPVGGGYFFAPPGARGGGDWVGSGMAARA
jgi:deferrochelatase/peroxidase EfeB